MNWIEQLAAYKPANEQEAQDQHVMVESAKTQNLLTRDNEVAHMTCSGFIMNAARDHVLFIHHNIYNAWGWTGGHADGDDNFLRVAIREAIEETGVEAITPITENIISLEIIPVFGHMKRGNYVSAHLHFNVTFALQAREDAALIVRPDENSAVAWVPVDQIATIVNEPFMIPIYEKIIAAIQKLD